jgi:hypothetical protein
MYIAVIQKHSIVYKNTVQCNIQTHDDRGSWSDKTRRHYYREHITIENTFYSERMTTIECVLYSITWTVAARNPDYAPMSSTLLGPQINTECVLYVECVLYCAPMSSTLLGPQINISISSTKRGRQPKL